MVILVMKKKLADSNFQAQSSKCLILLSSHRLQQHYVVAFTYYRPDLSENNSQAHWGGSEDASYAFLYVHRNTEMDYITPI